MKKTCTIVLLSLAAVVNTMAQKISVHLTFSGQNQQLHSKLDSLKITNITAGGTLQLQWPDTAATVQLTPGDTLQYLGYSLGFPVGMDQPVFRENNFRLFQTGSNPVVNEGCVAVEIPADGTVEMTLSDLQGRILFRENRQLGKGIHGFSLSPGNHRILFVTARYNTEVRTIRIMAFGSGSGSACRFQYAGMTSPASGTNKEAPLKSGQMTQESCILDNPTYDETYTFQFATNIPCPGLPTITWQGQVYHTIQIMSQCWLKENLNAGTMINGSQNQTDNGILEKYCYDNLPSRCDQYGGLYQWGEVMQYVAQQGAQGICPDGWHVPTDQEFMVLEGIVDTQYPVGDPTWELYSYRGFDVGKNLKTSSGWNTGIGTNLYGFSGLPAGSRTVNATFDFIGGAGIFWLSSEFSATKKHLRTLHCDYDNTYRTAQSPSIGYSVRCLKNN